MIHINDAFQTFDTDFSGTISKEELQKGFKSTIKEITDAEIDRIYDNMLADQEKSISWSSFLYAAMDSEILNAENLTKAFNFICNTEGQTTLTCEELKLSMIRRGHIFSAQAEEKQIDQILEQAGVHHDCGHLVKLTEQVEAMH